MSRAQASSLRDDLVAAIPNMRAFAISLCGNRDRADDLVQEALVKAWNHLDSFEAGTNLKAWLFTILRNAYFSELRKTKREIADSEGQLAAKLSVPPNSRVTSTLSISARRWQSCRPISARRSSWSAPRASPTKMPPTFPAVPSVR